jgi:hypothetical protein
MCDGAGNPITPVNGIQSGGTPCSKIPSSLINPIMAGLMSLYPPPNVANTLIGDFVNSPTKTLKEGELDVRLDHNFSKSDSVFARFSYDQATVFSPVGTAGFMNPDGFSSTQSLADHGRNAALSETHIFSPTAVNKATLGYDRIFNHILSFANGSCLGQKTGIPGSNLGGNVSCGLTDLSPGGAFWGLGDRGFAPFTGGTNVFFISDSFDKIHGSHDMKFGGEIRANQMNVLTAAFQDGWFLFSNAWTGCVFNLANPGSPCSTTSNPQSSGGFFATGFNGNNFADFLLGIPDLGLHDTVFQGPVTGRRWKLYRPYFQDDWRVTPSLTLNLGLAYAMVTPITESHNRQGNVNLPAGPSSPDLYLIPGVNSDSRVGVKLDWTALEPRIGLAWSPWGDHKTSIRAGYAIYHDSTWNQGAQGLWENPPFFEESAYVAFFPDLCPSATAVCASTIPVTGQSVSDGFPILTQPGTSAADRLNYGGNVWVQNLNWKQGQIQQFNLNIERLLPGDVLVTVGYAGSRGHHILVDGLNLNIASPSACGTVPGYTAGCGIATTQFASFRNFQSITDNGNAKYDSLQFKLETKSAKHGLYALLGYTFAKDYDNGLPDGLGSSVGLTFYPLPGANKLDKAFSQIQLNHNFTASVIYDLPFGKGKQFGSNWSGATNAVLGNWEFDVIEHITSGFPLFLVGSNSTGTNFEVNGSSINRPNRVCNGRLSNWTWQQYFDTSCFVDAPAGELGNSSRTPLFGPGFVNTDFSLIKNFPLPFREGTELQFRAEFFNLFNHPQFYLPGGTSGLQNIDTPGAATITQTVNNPRLIQFALKLRF